MGRNLRACRDRAKDFVRFVKEMAGLCYDCGQPFPPELLTFDHCQGVKAAEINDLVRNRATIRQFMDEMRKCRIVCRPCHDLREKRRNKWPEKVWDHYNKLFGGEDGH